MNLIEELREVIKNIKVDEVLVGISRPKSAKVLSFPKSGGGIKWEKVKMFVFNGQGQKYFYRVQKRVVWNLSVFKKNTKGESGAKSLFKKNFGNEQMAKLAAEEIDRGQSAFFK